MDLFRKNLKYLRKQNKWTQQEVSNKLGIGREKYKSYERSSFPGYEGLLSISSLFQVNLDQLLRRDLESEANLTFEDQNSSLDRILVIRVDANDQEEIICVPHKAAAGYTQGYSDPEYIYQLDVIKIPKLPQGSYRAFEIEGDSMLPNVESGDIIIARYIDDAHQIRNGHTYIILTESEGLVYKRIYNQLSLGLGFLLVSDNNLYQPYSITKNEIKEIWSFTAKISYSQ